MKRVRAHDQVMTRIRLWWYGVAIVPVLLMGWLGLGGKLPAIVVPFALFLFVFWLFSFIFALIGRMRMPREPRQ